VTNFTPVGNGSLVDKQYVDGVALGAGAVPSTYTDDGILELATGVQAASSTATDQSGSPLTLHTGISTSTPYTTGSFVVVSEADGKINPDFIDSMSGGAGNGTDGAVVFNGTNSYTSFASSSNNTYELLRNVYATNVTVSGTTTVDTNGYVIHWTGTLDGTGTIKGITGGNGESGSSGSGGATSSLKGFIKNVAGQAGKTGVAATNGTCPTQPTATTSPGSTGYPGGLGGNGNTKTGGTGAATGTVTISSDFLNRSNLLLNLFDFSTTTRSYLYIVPAGVAGGGCSGGGQDTTGPGGNGGGGGASGGLVMLIGNKWAGSFTIKSVGGDGGAGSQPGCPGSGAAGGGGGGAGGSGGLSIVIYNQKTWTGSYNLAGGSGGAAGLGSQPACPTGSSGIAGPTGNTGTYYEYNMSNLVRN
jgi:hypothetical protein